MPCSVQWPFTGSLRRQLCDQRQRILASLVDDDVLTLAFDAVHMPILEADWADQANWPSRAVLAEIGKASASLDLFLNPFMARPYP